MDVRIAITLIIVVARVAAAQDFREIKIEPSVDVGSYSILGYGDLKRFTHRENAEVLARNVLPRHEPEWQPFHTTIRIPVKRSIMVSIGTRGDANAKLAALRALEPGDIKSLACLRDISSSASSDIGRFSEMVELVVKPCEAWESPEGARAIAKLQRLKFFHIVSLDEHAPAPFGSIELIEAILQIKRLRFLEMPCDKLTETQIMRLSAHNYLEKIVLSSEKGIIDRTGLRAFAQMRTLRELRACCSSHIMDSDVLQFAESPNLELIQLRTDASLTCEQEFRRLRPDCQIEIEGFSDRPVE